MAATVILEMGFRLISLTWLIIPAESMLALQETALSPQPGFSSPVAGSRLPPLPAASPLGYLGEAWNLQRSPAPRGTARTLGQEPGPPRRLLPVPLSSATTPASCPSRWLELLPG